MFRDRKTFQDRTGNDCLNTTPVAREIIAGTGKWGGQQIQQFLHSKRDHQK